MRLAAMPQDKKLANQRARRHHHAENHPTIRVAVGHRIVITDHDKQHRQREISVVYRALFAGMPVLRIRFATGTNSGDHFFLAGNDHEKNVCRHDRAEHRTDVNKRGTRTEQLKQSPVKRDHERKQQYHQYFFLVFKNLAQRTIENPAANDGRNTDANRLHRRQHHHTLVDKISAGTKPINNREQAHAGKPGGISLKF